MTDVILQVNEQGIITDNRFIPLFGITRVGSGYALRVTGWVEATGALADERYFVGPDGPADSSRGAVVFRVEEIVQAGIVDFNHLAQAVQARLNNIVDFATTSEDQIILHQEGGSEITIDLDVSALQILGKAGPVVSAVSFSNGQLHVTTKSRANPEGHTVSTQFAGMGQATELTEAQVRDLAGGEISKAFGGVNYNPATDAYSGRTQTLQAWPAGTTDIANDAVTELKLATAVRNKLNSRAQAGGARKLITLSAVPSTTTGYNVGDLIDVGGVIWELVGATDDSHIVNGVAGHDGQNYTGVNNIPAPGDANYGTVNGSVRINFEWAPEASGVSLQRARVQFASAADAPQTLYFVIRGDTREELRGATIGRDGGRDESLQDGRDFYGYQSGATGDRYTLGTGHKFSLELYRDAALTQPITFHTANRWEEWLPRQTGVPSVPTVESIEQLAAAEARKRFTDSEKTKLDGLTQGLNQGQVDARIWSPARVGVSDASRKQGLITALDVDPYGGTLLGDLRAAFGSGALVPYLGALSASERTALQNALRPILGPSHANARPVTALPNILQATLGDEVYLVSDTSATGYGVVDVVDSGVAAGQRGWFEGSYGGIDERPEGLNIDGLIAFDGTFAGVGHNELAGNVYVVRGATADWPDEVVVDGTRYSVDGAAVSFSAHYRRIVNMTPATLSNGAHTFEAYDGSVNRFLEDALERGDYRADTEALRWRPLAGQYTDAQILALFKPEAAVGGPPFTQPEATPRGRAAVTSQNASSASFPMATSANLGPTGGLAVYEFADANGADSFSATFRVVDGAIQKIPVAFGTGNTPYIVGVRSRTAENDIRLMRVNTGNMLVGTHNVYTV